MSYITPLLLLVLIPVVAFLLRRPVAGGVILLFVLYTRLSDVGISQHGLPSVAQPLVLFLAAMTFYRRCREGGSRSLAAQAALWGAMVLYMATTLASVIWAVDTTVAFAQASDLAKNLLIVYIIVETFDTQRSLRMAIWALIAAAALLAGLTVFQAVTKTYDNSYFGLAQAPIRQIAQDLNGQRSSGPIGDPNFYGLILAAIVPLALLRGRDERGLFLRFMAMACALLLTAGVVLTYSRGALVALLMMVLLYIPLARVRLSHLLVALVILAPCTVLVPATYWQRVATLAPGAADSSVQKRIGSQEVALAIFSDHPVLGVGAGNYNATYFPYAMRLNVPSAASYAHDFYVELLAENGLTGMLTFAAAMFLAISLALRRRRAASRSRDLATEGLVTACLLSLSTYLIGIAFLPAAYPRYLWVLLGLTMSAALLGDYRARHAWTFSLPVSRAKVAGTPSFTRQVARGGILSYGSFLVSKLLVFASTLILARFLLPHDFGLVGFALLVLGFLDVLKNLGVTSALIYRQDIKDEDAGEAFVLSVALGLAFFGLSWLLAPIAATFFHDARVTSLMRVMSFTFVLTAFGGVHSALLQRKMSFGRRLIPDILLSLTKGAVSIVLALDGVGYWSLAWGQLAGAAIWTVACWYMLPWLPRLKVQWESARSLLVYGMHLTLVDLLGALVGNADYLVVGRVLGSGPLGLYTLAFSIPQILTISLAVALSRVLFPAYAAMQNDVQALRRSYLSILRFSAIALIPVGLGFCVTAPAFVHSLYKPVWWPSTPAMQALAIYATLFAVGWNAGDIYKATGKASLLWKLSIAQATVLVPALIAGAWLGGIVGVAIAQIVVMVPYSLSRFWMVRRIIGVDFGSIAAAIRLPLIAGGAMVVACLLVAAAIGSSAPAPDVFAAQVLVGAVAYSGFLLYLDAELRAGVYRFACQWLGQWQPEVKPHAQTAQVASAISAVRLNLESLDSELRFGDSNARQASFYSHRSVNP